MGDSQVRSPITPSIQGIITLLNYWCMKWCHMTKIGCHKRNFKFGHPSFKSWLRPWPALIIRILNSPNGIKQNHLALDTIK
jgi:hypothetical protein